jgi:hypothetical protein
VLFGFWFDIHSVFHSSFARALMVITLVAFMLESGLVVRSIPWLFTAAFAALSASSLPWMPLCPGIHITVTWSWGHWVWMASAVLCISVRIDCPDCLRILMTHTVVPLSLNGSHLFCKYSGGIIFP